jgi:large subunit ribosomal protein L33
VSYITFFFKGRKVNSKITNKKEIKTMGIKGKNDKMVVLACEDCKERNYTTTKNKKNIKERLELNKYCPACKKHTKHKETK